MGINEGPYDFVSSLGGSCIAALQLRKRELRQCSLPFDWLFHVDDSLFPALTKCFQENYCNWLKRENMQELKGDERGTSPYYQYKDLYTGFRFIHDFHKPIEDNTEFVKVKKRYAKRIKRLYEKIEKSTRIALILNSRWSVRLVLIETFHSMLVAKWPGKEFDIFIISFSQERNETKTIEDYCIVSNYKRAENSYDYFQTNYEWEFLDKISLKHNNGPIKRFIDFKCIRHGLHMYFLKEKRNILGLRIRIFGCEFDFSIGKY
jgi:hypothetical protein